MKRREVSAAELYRRAAPQLDADGFQLYRAAQRLTGFCPYDTFHYEDNRGAFEEADGHALLRYLEADHFQAVTWEVVPGTVYERAILGEIDKTSPEYKAFREMICADALDRMGYGRLINKPKKKIKGVRHER